MGLLFWMREGLAGEKKIAPEDLDLLFVTDSPADAVAQVVDCHPKPSVGYPRRRNNNVKRAGDTPESASEAGESSPAGEGP